MAEKVYEKKPVIKQNTEESFPVSAKGNITTRASVWGLRTTTLPTLHHLVEMKPEKISWTDLDATRYQRSLQSTGKTH